MEQALAHFLITLPWIIVWVGFYLGGTRIHTLPINPKLKVYSTILLLCITVFYTALHITAHIAHFSLLAITGAFFSTLGAFLMIKSRTAMKNLSALEVVYSINPKPTFSGVYRFFRHPMYLGIFIILGSALTIVPNVYASAFLIPAAYCIMQKAKIESEVMKQQL